MLLSDKVKEKIKDIYITNGIEHEVLDRGENYLFTFKDPLTHYHFSFLIGKRNIFVDKDFSDLDLLYQIDQAISALLEERKLVFNGEVVDQNDCNIVSEYAGRDGCV